MAEALAVRLAVMTASFSNIKSLIILSDSLTLIKLLKGRESRPALFGILFDIYQFSSLFDAISFSFIPRLNNQEADLVAKSALSICNASSDGVPFCVLCHEVQETCPHLFFSCPYSFAVWESLVKGILREKFTAVWSDIVALISEPTLPPTEIFLVRYALQVAVHSIWRERNARRHGEEPKDARLLSILVDKIIRLQLLAVKARGQAYLERSLRSWFGTRLVSDPT